MQYELCRHIRTNGLRCKSPTLHGSTWCFYHGNLHTRHQGFRHTEATRGYLIPGHHIELAALEDRESVQVALSVVINALATGQLEPKRATALLYGLQLASMNAANLHNQPYGPDVVRTSATTLEGLPLADPAIEVILPYEPEEEEDQGDDDDDDDYDDNEKEENEGHGDEATGN